MGMACFLNGIQKFSDTTTSPKHQPYDIDVGTVFLVRDLQMLSVT